MIARDITVDWLHGICPDEWTCARRGIWYMNWSLHSVVENGNYDDGPFVWSVAPSHDANMRTIEKPCNSAYTILVMERCEDVKRLMQLLGFRMRVPE